MPGSLITRTRIVLARVSRIAALAGLYALLLTAILVSADVSIRKLFGIAFVGADELAGYALAMATSWALSFAFFQGAHIRVNVLHMNLKPIPKAWLDLLAVVAMAALIGLLAWQVGQLTFESWTFDDVSNTPLRVPLWIPQTIFLAGIILFFLSAIVVLLESAFLLRAGKHEELIALVDESDDVGGYLS